MLSLKAFSENNFTKLFKFESEVYVTADDEVIIEYHLKGPTRHLHFPPTEEGTSASRRDELWKTTCLEAFFSYDHDAQGPYLEVNCSPNGNWNAYSFSSYRQGMKPENYTQVTLLQTDADVDGVLFRMKIQSPALRQLRKMGITAVIEFSDGSKSYFALNHPGPQADFHNKAGFTYSL